MTVQPVHHWRFEEREGTTAVDDVSGVQATLSKAELNGHGRIGNAIHLLKKDSHVNLGKEVGQFGTSDFTVAFGMKNISNHGDNELDIIGDQVMQGHGNFFAVRLFRARIFFHVDEDSRGKNYVRIMTDPLPMIKNRTWFHVAVVREGPTLKIYIDGVLAAEGTSETGVADIHNDIDVKLGHSRRGTPTAHYEDLRIYHTALNAAQVQNLVPPLRPLRVGEIELVATDGATVILTQDVADLSRFSPQFQKLRLGPDTGATLYKGTNFGDVAQKLYADIPDTRFTRLGAFPQSVHIWSAAGEPFTGKWIIKAPNGQYLSRRGATLTTAPHRLLDELFVFHYNLHHDQPQLIPATQQEGLLLQVADEPTVLLVDDSESLKDAFSIVNASPGQWLHLNQDNTFTWTDHKEDRAVFFRAAKMADHEGQVGELAPGEVALYENIAYWGRTWILSDSEHDVAGNYTSLSSFHGLDDQTSSIRLGPDTGVTLFKNRDHQADDGKREEEIEMIVDNVPDLKESQVGNDAISSLQIFRAVAPETIFTGVTSKLSQDYRMVDDQLEEFSSYRTILRFAPDAGAVQVSATDLTTIEVEGTLHAIDEVRSVTLNPNGLRQIMITSEADGLSTPGLKFRTKEMPENQFVVIFPDQEAHQQIAELEDDALWNATDAQGNLIIDQTKHTRSEVASIQNTIKRSMATVVTLDDDADPNANVKAVGVLSPVVSKKQMVSGDVIDNPWTLNFQPLPTSNISDGSGDSVASPNIWEEPIEQSNFEQLFTTAEIAIDPRSTSSVSTIDGNVAARSFGGFFRNIRDTIKDAVSVTLGVLNGAFNAIIDIGGQIVRFVLDTAKKVADFVTAVVEKVVEEIQKFIEFLQFIFDWDDILATKEFLVTTINSAFDSAEQLVASAKPQVSAFVDDLQEDIADGIDSLIRSLGVDPAADDDDGFELPEAAEWFLNKLLAGLQSPAAILKTIFAALSSDTSEESSFEQAFSRFLAAVEDIGGVVAEVFEGLVETIEALITNPLRPELALAEILEACKEVSIQILDFAENVVLGVLDLVVAVIDLLQDVLNTEIQIPLISNLFELLGAGKLTILNLASLLVAVPATVLSKLIFGEAPFQDLAPPEISEQPLIADQLNLRAIQDGDVPADAAPSEPAFDREKIRRKVMGFGVTAIAADVLNGLITTFLDLIPEPENEADDFKADEKFVIAFLETTSLMLSGISWLASFPSSPKEPGGYPYILSKGGKINRDDNRQMVRERVLWGYRTGLLALDTAFLIIARITFLIIARITDKFPIERIERSTPLTIYFTAGAAVIDLALTSLFLAREDDRGRKVAQEVIALTPSIFGPLRLVPETNPKLRAIAYLVLAKMNNVATVSNFAFGIKFLKDDVKALEEVPQGT